MVAQPVVLWVQIPNPPKYPDSTPVESRDLLFAAVEKQLTGRLTPIGYEPSLVLDEGPAPKTGSTRSSDGYVIRLEKWNHRNRSYQEILDNPNAPKSETSLELRLWPVVAGVVDRDQKLKSKAGGAYFGTTDKSNMSGPPDAKALAIKLVNKQRMEAIALATWEAVRFNFPERKD